MPLNNCRFTWDKTHEVLNFINSLFEYSEQISLKQFKELMTIPETDPLNENFLFRDSNTDELVGVLRIINELPISRMIGLIYCSSHSQYPKKSRLDNNIILTEMIRLLETCAASNQTKTIHMQTFNKSMLENALILLKWNKIKTYWKLSYTPMKTLDIHLPEGFHIRHFIYNQDEKLLTNIQNESFAKHWGFSPNTVKQIHHRVRMAGSYPECISFIEKGSSIAAYSWGYIDESIPNKLTGVISMIGVHPLYRGKHLGTLAVISSINSLTNKGVYKILLEVDSDNKAAIKLYIKLGFVKKSESIWYEKNLN